MDGLGDHRPRLDAVRVKDEFDPSPNDRWKVDLSELALLGQGELRQLAHRDAVSPDNGAYRDSVFEVLRQGPIFLTLAKRLS